MACCAAIAAVIGLVRAAWFRLLPGRRPVEPTFAPPAHRSADGTPPLRTEQAGVPRRRGLTGSALVGVAVGTAAYALAVTILRATPVVRTLDGPWVVRDAGLVALVAVALLAGLAGGGARSVPAVLLGAGVAWTELGLLDMHLLGLFELRLAALPLDLLLHGSGPLLVVLAAHRLARPRPRLETSTP